MNLPQSHQEGGTKLSWTGDRLLRSNFGEAPDQKEFRVESEFLRFLRQFYDWQTSKSADPNKITELEAWRLILQLAARLSVSSPRWVRNTASPQHEKRTPAPQGESGPRWICPYSISSVRSNASWER